MFKRFLATIAGATMAFGGLAAATPAAASAANCAPGHWPSYVQGRPASAEIGNTGLALWRDGRGVWHLWASEAGIDRAVFRGTIVTDGAVHSVAHMLEGGDVTSSLGRHWVRYRFTNFGHVDGIDFVLTCATRIRISGTLDGEPLDVEQVFIGEDDTHPAGMPIRIWKQH